MGVGVVVGMVIGGECCIKGVVYVFVYSQRGS